MFGSIATGEYKLSDGGAVAIKVKDGSDTGAVADGAGFATMTAGVQYWEREVVKNDAGHYPGAWYFGVCRPGIDLIDGKGFHYRDATWMMEQDNLPDWLSDWVVVGLGQRRHFDHVLGQQAMRHDCDRASWTAAGVHLVVLEGQGGQDPRRLAPPPQ